MSLPYNGMALPARARTSAAGAITQRSGPMLLATNGGAVREFLGILVD
jgi:hypothetical protein